MEKFSWRNALGAVVLLLAYPLGLSGKCSKQVIFINAVGQDFTFRQNLRATDLNVFVDGKQTQVASLSLNSSPRRILLMVDTSGSMQASERQSGWGFTIRTAAFAFDSIPLNAQVAWLTFNDLPRNQENGFRDRSEVGPKILELAKQGPHGPTALLDSIEQALSLFQPPQLGDAIFLVTDGVDTKSKVSIKKLREQVIKRGLRIFLFLVPHEAHVPTAEEETERQVEDFVEYTGGYVVRIPWSEIGTDKSKVATLVKQISSQVGSMYQVELELSNATNLKGRVKIGLADQKHGNETLAYPRQLAPCAPVNPMSAGECSELISSPKD